MFLRPVNEAGEKGITSAMLHRSPGVSKSSRGSSRTLPTI
jgi:hypothetical protein